MKKDELKHLEVEPCGTTIFVTRDSGKEMVNMDNCESRIQDGYFFWTLEDIAGYIHALFPNERVVITVWEESGLTGRIFRYGNSADYWELHGTTRGFA